MKGLPASALTVCALIGLWTVGGRLWPKSMSVRPPQYVVISLDGGGSLDMWQMSRAWALGMQQDTRRVRMTYFVSGVYLIEDTNAMSYEAPRQPRGLSLIGFGGSAGEVSRRVAQMRAAVEEGHEIANHAGGHFRGVDWTLAEWKRDITTLNRRMVAAAANDLPVSGFRAPGLTGNGAMYSALRDLQYRYDASRAAAAHAWPSKRDGLWQFTLARVRTVMSDASVISMDYSFYRLHSGAKEDTRGSDAFEQDMYATYVRQFEALYHGNRAPFQVLQHFDLFNGGVYWRALRRFAERVCGLPEVECLTYRDLVDRLEALTPEQLEAYRRGRFPRLLAETARSHGA